VVFGDPTDDNQSRIHSLEATARSVSDSERLGERSLEKEGDARLEKKHVVEEREKTRVLGSRVIWSTPVPPVIARVPMSRASPLSEPDLCVFPVLYEYQQAFRSA